MFDLIKSEREDKNLYQVVNVRGQTHSRIEESDLLELDMILPERTDAVDCAADTIVQNGNAIARVKRLIRRF